MIRGHVFIVNEDTLPTHLNYQFVGVGAGDKNNNISLLSDMLRIKKDDFIFFYIEKRGVKDGRFFGIFRAVDNLVYHLTGEQACKPNLPFKLIYRKKIRPYQVYSKGILEWIALDKLPTYAREVLWMLIYRKMKGKRGNTMLFPWETERLISLIIEENGGIVLEGNHFDFDSTNYEIIRGDRTITPVMGTSITLQENVIRRSETHFQAYLLQNLQTEDNTFLSEIFGRNILWIGNEVFAGSSVQKIDILIIEKKTDIEYLYKIIELKHPRSRDNINLAPKQLEYYINWARDDIGGHLRDARRFNIKPVLLCLTREFGAVPNSVRNEINALGEISNHPEIWEIDYNLNFRRIL